MRKTILTLLLSSFVFPLLFAQLKEKSVSENDVKGWFEQLSTTTEDQKRVELANRIQNGMVDILIEKNDFFYEFPDLKDKYIGVKMSSDEQVHMYTWNILLSDGTPLYFALFQHNEYSLVEIFSQGHSKIPSTSGYVSKNNWYGALYYDIHPIKFRDKEMYLVFGLMTSTDGETQHKVIDVMAFTKKTMKLGAPSFITPWAGRKKQSRVVFEYDKNAQMSLEYNKKKKSIIFDHLSPIRKTIEGKEIKAPDMSYDAFVYKKDIWTYVEDVNVKNVKSNKKK